MSYFFALLKGLPPTSAWNNHGSEIDNQLQ